MFLTRLCDDIFKFFDIFAQAFFMGKENFFLAARAGANLLFEITW